MKVTYIFNASLAQDPGLRIQNFVMSKTVENGPMISQGDIFTFAGDNIFILTFGVDYLEIDDSHDGGMRVNVWLKRIDESVIIDGQWVKDSFEDIRAVAGWDVEYTL